MAALKARKFAPYYLLHGDEPFFIDRLVKQVEHHALPEHERGFNQLVLYGKDADVGAVIQNARRYPMMAEKQLVLVKEAQELSDLGREAAQKMLLQYLQKPSPSTLLVMAFKTKLDARKAWVKEADKHGVVFNSEKVKDWKLAEWILSTTRAEGIKMAQNAADLLAEHLGNDLSRIFNEIEKLNINLQPGQEITAQHISKYVGISKDYNVFELQKALLSRDALKANQIVNYFGANPKDNPLIPIIASLYNYYIKVLQTHLSPDKSEGGVASALGIPPFIAKDYVRAAKVWPPMKVFHIISQLRLADCRSKGIDAGEMNEKQILQEVVFNILH